MLTEAQRLRLQAANEANRLTAEVAKMREDGERLAAMEPEYRSLYDEINKEVSDLLSRKVLREDHNKFDGLIEALMLGNIPPEVAAEGFRKLAGAKRDLNLAVQMIEAEIVEADDSFAEGGKWLTKITTAITEAIKRGEQNGD